MLKRLIKKITMTKIKGKISQILGPVVDVIFENEENYLPGIYESLEVNTLVGEINIRGSVSYWRKYC